MKMNWKKLLQDLQCSLGLHAWKRTASSPDYLAGFNTRGCDRCPASQVYASELGRWIDNKR